MKRPAALAVALAISLISAEANAHLLPKQHATMRIVDNSAFFVVSVPATALHDIDEDGDGLISSGEMQRHEQDIMQQFTHGFHVQDTGNTPTDTAIWLTLPHTDGGENASDYVVVLHRIDFAEAPRNPTVEIDLFGARAGEDRYAFRATRDAAVENVTLARQSPVFTFFEAS